MINQTNFFLGKPKIANKFNNCNMPTQMAELIKYLNEVLTIIVLTVPSAFFSFKKKFVMHILLFSTLLTSIPCVFRVSSALVEIFLKQFV